MASQSNVQDLTPDPQNSDGGPQGRDGNPGAGVPWQQEAHRRREDSVGLSRSNPLQQAWHQDAGHPSPPHTGTKGTLIILVVPLKVTNIPTWFVLKSIFYKPGHVGIVNLCMSLKDVAQRWASPLLFHSGDGGDDGDDSDDGDDGDYGDYGLWFT